MARAFGSQGGREVNGVRGGGRRTDPAAARGDQGGDGREVCSDGGVRKRRVTMSIFSEAIPT